MAREKIINYRVAAKITTLSIALMLKAIICVDGIEHEAIILPIMNNIGERRMF